MNRGFSYESFTTTILLETREGANDIRGVKIGRYALRNIFAVSLDAPKMACVVILPP